MLFLLSTLTPFTFCERFLCVQNLRFSSNFGGSWYPGIWYCKFADSVYIFVGNLHFSFYFFIGKTCLQKFVLSSKVYFKLFFIKLYSRCCCFESRITNWVAWKLGNLHDSYPALTQVPIPLGTSKKCACACL